jgi:hypothetical protein
MAQVYVTPVAANDNTRERHPISFAQAKALASLPSYLRGGRI